MKNKEGFMLGDAVLCMMMCSVLCLCVLACMRIEMNQEEKMTEFEKRVNASWEEVFAELKHCSACEIEEIPEQEAS